MLDNRIDLNFKKGESKDYTVTVTDELGSAVDLTGGRAKFTVKQTVDAVSADIEKDSDVGPTEVELTDPANGQFVIKLVPSDTSSLTAGEYFYDIWVELASGKRYPVVCPSSFFIEQTITTF